jgi:hypothetical protein
MGRDLTKQGPGPGGPDPMYQAGPTQLKVNFVNNYNNIILISMSFSRTGSDGRGGLPPHPPAVVNDPPRRFTISVKEISMESNSALDQGSSSIAPESTGVEARKQPVRLDDRDFLEAVSRAVLRELEGGFNLSGPPLGTIVVKPIVITVGPLPPPLSNQLNALL